MKIVYCVVCVLAIMSACSETYDDSELRNELARLLSENEKMQSQLTTLEANNQSLQSEITDLNNSNTALHSEITDLNSSNTALQLEIEDVKTSNSANADSDDCFITIENYDAYSSYINNITVEGCLAQVVRDSTFAYNHLGDENFKGDYTLESYLEMINRSYQYLVCSAYNLCKEDGADCTEQRYPCIDTRSKNWYTDECKVYYTDRAVTDTESSLDVLPTGQFIRDERHLVALSDIESLLPTANSCSSISSDELLNWKGIRVTIRDYHNNYNSYGYSWEKFCNAYKIGEFIASNDNCETVEYNNCIFTFYDQKCADAKIKLQTNNYDLVIIDYEDYCDADITNL